MFSNVFIPIFLFGMLVFIHELGHFTVAKLCGVFVERFAIGFGPAIFKKKLGETEYALCIFPLGGYVKMRGEELPETEEERKAFQSDPRSFAVQNVWKRIAIVIMGPTSNFLLPIVLFAILFMVGMPSPSSKIGGVAPGSVAEKAGLRAGDKIISIQNTPVVAWPEVTRAIQARPNMETTLEIDRDGTRQKITLTPSLEDDKNEFGEPIKSGKIGIDFVAFKPMIGVSNYKSPAYVAGMRTGDLIQSIDGQKINYWWQLENAFSNPDPKKIEVLRDGKTETFSITKSTLENSGIERSELFIETVVEKSVAAEMGLKVGDKINSINGQKIAYWSQFRDVIMNNKGEKVSIEVIRDGAPVTVEMSPQEVEQKNQITNETKKVRQIGVKSKYDDYPIDYHYEKYTNVFTALTKGFQHTWDLTVKTFIGLGKLASGKLSVHTMGGPISIFSMATTSYEAGGWNAFFNLMALLSITLAALNILPIPVLDGGHLLFFIIEAIKGSPVQMKVRQMAMQVGFYMLMALMVLVFYVDINRFFVGPIKAFFN